MTHKTQKQQLFYFLAPSVAELVISALILAFVLIGSFSPYKQWYAHNFADYNVASVIGTYINSLVVKILGKLAGTVALSLFWGLIGLFVFMGIVSLLRFITEFNEDIEERKFVWPTNSNPDSPLLSLLSRTTVRLIAAGGFVFYIVFLLPKITSYIPAAYHAGTSIFSGTTILSTVIFIVAGVIILHVGTLLLRITFLKPRLWD